MRVFVRHNVSSSREHGIGQCTGGIQTDENANILDHASLLVPSRGNIESIVNVTLLIQNRTKVKENG